MATPRKEISSNPRILLENIAVLTDFSPSAANGLRLAIQLARTYSSRLTLVHAYAAPLLRFPNPTAEVVLGHDPNALGEKRGIAERRMTDQLDKLSSCGLTAKAILREGPILRVLQEVTDADLFVIGTAGRSGSKKMVMGSTAEAVFRSSKVPVLTVGPHSTLGKEEDSEYVLKTILFATDREAPMDALHYALSLAEEHNARLLILHIESEEAAPFSFDKEMLKAACIAELRGMVPADAELWCKLECAVAFGETAELILEKANRNKADLIVMGAKSVALPGVSSHLPGGIAYRVATAAPCPVLTVRRAD